MNIMSKIGTWRSSLMNILLLTSPYGSQGFCVLKIWWPYAINGYLILVIDSTSTVPRSSWHTSHKDMVNSKLKRGLDSYIFPSLHVGHKNVMCNIHNSISPCWLSKWELNILEVSFTVEHRCIHVHSWTDTFEHCAASMKDSNYIYLYAA